MIIRNGNSSVVSQVTEKMSNHQGCTDAHLQPVTKGYMEIIYFNLIGMH